MKPMSAMKPMTPKSELAAAQARATVRLMGELERTAVLDACRYADSWLAFRLGYERMPGVQVAVLHDDEVLLSSAHGVSSELTGEALRTDHLFRVASHSKTFTATAVMQFVERGRLRLDDTVGERLPELAGSGIADVTVRELLSHGGGVIRDGLDGDFWQLFRAFPDRAELLGVAAEAADVLPRNDRFKYSNIAYSLVGLILEGVSGSSYADVVRDGIITPLGLTDTGPEYDPSLAERYAGGHTALAYADRRLPIDHVDTAAMAAATGFYSTADDLVRYASAHFVGDGRLLGDDARRQVQRTEWKVAGTESSYGLGFESMEIGDRRVLGHGGGYPGHITRTWFDPVDRLAVSVLTNAIDGSAGAWAAAIVKLIDLASSRAHDASSNAHDAGDDTPVDLVSFTGRFASLWGVSDIVTLGGCLYQLSPTMADPAASPTRLEVVDEDTLRIADTDGFRSQGEELRFTRDDGTIVSVRGGGGSTAQPYDAFRAAVAERSGVSLGEPLVV